MALMEESVDGGLQLSESFSRRGDDEAREHLLAIPDDSNGHSNHGSRSTSRNDSQRRKSSSHVSIRNLVEPKNQLLKGISVEIKAGQIYCIIGPSGSGKSTFLRSINRLWEPPADSIFLDGEDIVNMNVLTVRRRIGMLFQSPMLFDGTVADNVRYGPSLQGKTLTDKEVIGYLEQADLDASFAQKSIIGLSVGQAQRVALARTLANKPEVLLLDEPTSALDPISTHHIEQSVMELKRSKGLTVIMVSHSFEQVKRIADYVCLIVAGELLEVFKPTELDTVTHPQAQEYLEAAQRH
ncbi:hypothetical protein M758_4G033200 [Ceratodon purpureus]|nr:hypothetical protein M758_4G033200 [Ceratodon purpureus]